MPNRYRIKGYKPFLWCCGMAEIGGFYNYGTVEGTKEALLAVIGRKWKPAYICTTIPRQKSAIKALEQIGAKPIRKFKNLNSGNVVTIWLKVNDKPSPLI